LKKINKIFAYWTLQVPNDSPDLQAALKVDPSCDP